MNVLHLDNISRPTQASYAVKQENNGINKEKHQQFTLRMEILVTSLHAQAHILQMRCEYLMCSLQ